MKECSKCKVTKPLNEFYKKDKIYYRHICKKCSNVESAARNTKYKIDAINYKGSQCQVCGYKNYYALELHHKDPSKKDFTFGKIHRSLSSMKKELDKCILLCSNCHREEHESIKVNISYQQKNRANIKKEIVDYKGGKCEICGYLKCLSALELHHKDPSTKSFGIGDSRRRLSKIEDEVDKCVLICSNCHKEEHHS